MKSRLVELKCDRRSIQILVPAEWVAFETEDAFDLLALVSTEEPLAFSDVAILICRDHGETAAQTAKSYAILYAKGLQETLDGFYLQNISGYRDSYRLKYEWSGEGNGTGVDSLFTMTEGAIIVVSVEYAKGSELVLSPIIERVFESVSYVR